MSEHTYVKKLKPHNQIPLDKVIVKVGAKWCKACKNCAPEYEKLAEKCSLDKTNVHFYSIDSDVFGKDSSMMKEIKKIVKDTNSLPSFYFFKNGKMVNKLEGFSEKKFKKCLNDLI